MLWFILIIDLLLHLLQNPTSIKLPVIETDVTVDINCHISRQFKD